MLTHLPLDTVRDRALMMRAMPTFAGVDDESLALIAGYARMRVFRAGDVLAREGQPIDEVFAVVRGKVIATRGGNIVNLPDPAPSMIGLLPVLARDPDGFHVVADEETVVLALPTQVVIDVLEEHFVVVRQILRLAAQAVLQRLRAVGHSQGMLAELMTALPNDGVVPRSRGKPQSRVEMVLRLRESALLAHADLDALFAILEFRTDVTLRPGEKLWKVGDAVGYIAMIESGTLRCEAADCAPLTVGAGAMLGRLEALSGEAVRYDVTAETEVHLQRVEMSGLMTVFEVHFDLARKILGAISSALLELPVSTTVERMKSW